ncbi:MAG: penicillin acylase family protein [Castellaniella sp.]
MEQDSLAEEVLSRNGVRIVVDRWGVPHIYGDSLLDTLYGQGYYVARERLWQLDYWRRCGLGLLSEAFGSRFVERDRAARLFRYRGDMAAEWASYGDDARACVQAFVQGVNAFIEQAYANPQRLPPEFQALDYLPSLWAAEDVVVIRNHGLYYNIRDEVSRARVLRDFGAAVEDLRRQREPARALQVPEGLDLADIPDDVLRIYELGMTPPVIGPAPSGPSSGRRLPEGSNNWTIAGTRTASGRPILANDPHRTMTGFPGMRYLVHLSSPELDAIGGSEIGLPGLFTGHNGRIAFGMTFYAADQEDLYVYALNPADAGQYRYGDGWESMRVVHETIPVRNAAPVPVELAFTRHGPVIHQDVQHGRAFAVRAAWLEAGAAPYLGGLAIMRARSWLEFNQACRHWKAPCANYVYADGDGNIGWRNAGLIPVRKTWDGTLPVPGDGRHEWQGFFDPDDLPRSFNPPCGWLATANEMNIPPEYPQDRHLGYEWFSRLRKERIDEVLGAGTQHTVADSNALQNDTCSLLAREVLAIVRTLHVEDAAARQGLDLLLGWDACLDVDSAPALLFEYWYRSHLRPALLQLALAQHLPMPVIAEAARALRTADLVPDRRVDLLLLRQPAQYLGADGEQRLATLMGTTLAQAMTRLRRRHGDNVRAWRWGSVHTARMVHPLRALLRARLDEHLLATPRVARGGSGDTVGLTAHGPDFTQVVGATLRLVIDVGDWDASVAMNAPGQSGRLDSRFASHLLAPWARGESFPLLYSRERVMAALAPS